MSTTTTVTVTCDIRRAHPLADAEGQTVRFSLDGKDYEADLCGGCLGLLAADLEPFTARARKLNGLLAEIAAAKAAGARRPAAQRTYSRQARSWALGKGLLTSERGRIPDEVMRQYEAAHRGRS